MAVCWQKQTVRGVDQDYDMTEVQSKFQVSGAYNFNYPMMTNLHSEATIHCHIFQMAWL